MKQALNIIISILIPPLAVFMKFGVGKQLLINVLLTLLFILPGAVHAVWTTALYND